MSIVIIVSLHRKLKHTKKRKKKKKEKKLGLSVLILSSGCHAQSSPYERTPRQVGYVGARAKARAIHLLWYTC